MYDTKVTNVVFDITPERKIARRIEWIQGGKRGGRDVTKNDLVFITNGSAVENTRGGTTTPRAKWNRDIEEGSIWAMWRNIAAQDPAFGQPDKFCTDTDKTSYESACIRTLDDKVAPYIQKICQRDPYRYNFGSHHRRLGDSVRFQLDDVMERRAQPALQERAEEPV